MDIDKELEAFTGEFVRVTICEDSFTRNNFDSKLSVGGKLEKHPHRDAYRVVVNEDTYTYFEPGDVVGCMPKELDGAFPTQNTVFLQLSTDSAYTKFKNVEYSYERVLHALGRDHIKLVPMLRKKWEKLLGVAT